MTPQFSGQSEGEIVAAKQAFDDLLVGQSDAERSYIEAKNAWADASARLIEAFFVLQALISKEANR